MRYNKSFYKYSYIGSPEDLLQYLLKYKILQKIGDKYYETSRDSVVKAVKADRNFKVINEANGLNSTNKNEFVQLLLKMYLKLDSGTKLDASDYKGIEKFGKAIQNDSDELRNIYASFTGANNKPVDVQKKSLESLIKTVAPNILLADTIRNLSKKSKGSSLSSANKRELKTAVMVIATSAAQGNDMTDNIIDELGDFYNAVYKTNDDKLISAYDELRATADGNAKVQAKAATALLAMLK